MSLRRWARTPVGRVFEAGMRRVNDRHPWSHNDHFHGWILANLPVPCRAVLDVGCGRGELLAALAPQVTSVVGNDADAAMRREAAHRCSGLANVSVVDGPWTEIGGPFDAITMIAVLHHLEITSALQSVSRMLAPGGRFLAVGLAAPSSMNDHLWDAASIVTNPIIGYLKHPRPSRAGAQQPPFPVRDPTMTYDEIYAAVTEVMPGAALRHRIAFRHTISWTKPK